MAKKKPLLRAKPTGRPRMKTADDAQIAKRLAGIGCKNPEIAAIMGISVDTLPGHFAENLLEFRTTITLSL